MNEYMPGCQLAQGQTDLTQDNLTRRKRARPVQETLDERPWEAFEILKRNCKDSAIPASESVRTYDPEATIKLESPEGE
jgi:hypothetical protein